MALDRDPNHVFRDFVTAGVPSSGNWNPRKPEIRQLLMEWWQTLIALVGDAGGLELPNLLISMTVDPDEGDENNIIASPNLPVPSGSGVAVFSIVIEEANTGPVTINGKRLLSNAGNTLVAGALTADGVYLFLDNGDSYRLLSDQATAAIAAAAEAAAVDAQAAAEAAQAVSSEWARPVSRAALKMLNTATRTDALLIEAGREDLVVWDPIVPIAVHQSDTQEIQYIAPNPAANGAWVVKPLAKTVTNPVAGQRILAGTTVVIDTADGAKHTYTAISSFVWSNLFAHEFSASPTLAALSKPFPVSAIISTPSGFTPPPFTVRHVSKNRVATSLDRLEDYRAAYIPLADRTYHCDNVSGSPSNNGLTKATARSALVGTTGAPGVVSLVNGGTTPALVYLYAGGPAYGRNGGLRNDQSMTRPHAIIGINDADGNPPILSNGYETADVSWSANGTYPHVWQTGTGTMTQPGRVWDLSVPFYIQHHISGRRYRLPSEYVRKTNLAAVAATPGSYWFDSANSLFYVNRIGGGVPVLNGDLIIARSTSNINMTASHIYIENVIMMTGVRSGAAGGKTYLNECVLLGSRVNGINSVDQEEFGTRNLIVLDSEMDNINYHDARGGPVGTLFHEINPMSLRPDVFMTGGSMQNSTAHENCVGWTTNPYFAGSSMDNITDVGTSQRIIYGGWLGPTRQVEPPIGRAHVYTGDNAKHAIYDVGWAGDMNGTSALFSGSVANPMKVLHTDLPYDASRWHMLTSSW